MSEKYDKDSVNAVLSRIETELKSFIMESYKWREEHVLQLDELRKCVSSHEKFKYWVLGLAAATGAAGNKLLTLLTGGGNK